MRKHNETTPPHENYLSTYESGMNSGTIPELIMTVLAPISDFIGSCLSAFPESSIPIPRAEINLSRAAY